MTYVGSMELKLFLGIVLSLGLIFTSLPATGAQDSDLPAMPGFGAPVTWTDESGAAIASATVHGLEHDFRGYEEGWDPQFGYTYVLVDVSVENESDRAIIIEAYTFLLVDDHGARHNRMNLRTTEVETFNDDLPLAPGESAQVTIGYQIPAHASASLLAWNPVNQQMHFVVLSTDVSENSAIVWGQESTSVLTDDFTNPVATFQVVGINDTWADYDEYSTPEDDSRYVAVRLAVSNQTDRPVSFEHYDFALANADGSESRVARVSVKEDAEAPFRDSVPLQAGERIEVVLVFEVHTNTEPIAVMWRLNYSASNMVIIAEPPATPGEATPDAIATPS